MLEEYTLQTAHPQLYKNHSCLASVAGRITVDTRNPIRLPG